MEQINRNVEGIVQMLQKHPKVSTSIPSSEHMNYTIHQNQATGHTG